MATIAINITKNLREKLGDEGSEDLVTILNQINAAQIEEMERLNGHTFEKFQTELNQFREILESKIDTEIGKLNTKIDTEYSKLETKIDSTQTALRGEFKSGMAELRADLIKWMFIFWASAILTIVAGYFLKLLTSTSSAAHPERTLQRRLESFPILQ